MKIARVSTLSRAPYTPHTQPQVSPSYNLPLTISRFNDTRDTTQTRSQDESFYYLK